MTVPSNHDFFSIPFRENYTLQIQSSPFCCSILNEKKSPIWNLASVRFSDTTERWHHAERVKILQQSSHSTTCLFSCPNSTVTIRGNIVQNNGFLTLQFEAEPQSEASWISLDFCAQQDEHFLGLGERFDQIDQRGNRVVLKVLNGASGGKTYKPVPFYISSKGYGAQILTSALCILHLATPDEPNIVSIRNHAPSLTIRLFTGKTSKDILTEYTSFCGRQKLPPAWVFGPWKSRDWTVENQQTAEEDIVQGRRHHLAGTVKVIDAAWEPYIHSFTFDEKRWPNAEAFIRRVHQLGYKLILWISPWLVKQDPPTPTYLECARRGFFIKNPDGEVYVHRLANSPDFFGTCIDFTNPEARAWWQDHIRRLVRMGADGFKTDFGEQVPDDAVFYDGSTGHEMHNLYPVLYNQTTYEALNSETQGVLLARSAWDGSQPYCALFAGDQSSDFSPATGLPSVITAGQNAGLSGFPYWTCDIGGYFGSPTEETFIRWTQFGAFSPIMQVHGLGKREPWNFSARTLEIYRRYAQLHMDLFPYIYTYAKIASETGLPVLRALPIEFPDDKRIWEDISAYEYCLGEALLVAPVYFGANNKRLTYLPKGSWRDFWNGKHYQGGCTYEMESPLELIPVAVKAGSIIPFLDPSPETLLPTEDPQISTATNHLKLQIYPGQEGQFTLYDGTQFTWEEETSTLQISNSPIDRFISVKVFAEESKHLKMQAFDEQEKKIAIRQGSLNGDLDFYQIQVNRQTHYLIQWKESTGSIKN